MAFDATGGTTSTPGDGYKYWTFTSSGTLTVTSDGTVEYLVVAGGGAGGRSVNSSNAGGGGAGGLLTGTGLSLTAAGGPYAITVGAGGVGSTGTTATVGANGGNSSIAALVVATGGGGGGSTAGNGANGGSGGGGSAATTTAKAPGTGTVGQGHDGGTGVTNSTAASTAGGGGGGASAVGGNASGTTGGNGGAGTTAWGTTYAGGGGGAAATSGSGGSGGGGTGQRGSTKLGTTDGTANTGGGGGGVSSTTTGFGGNGGSGIVILRALLSTGTTHSATGAVTGGGSTISAAANRFRAHASSGAVAGAGAVTAGSAVYSAKHTSTGVLTGQLGSVVGASKRFRQYSATGALTGAGSSVVGIAVHRALHSAAGALFGSGASLTGVVSRYRVFGATGLLIGSGASLSGAVVHARINDASGGIVGLGAVLGGFATRTPFVLWHNNNPGSGDWKVESHGGGEVWTDPATSEGAWSSATVGSGIWTIQSPSPSISIPPGDTKHIAAGGLAAQGAAFTASAAIKAAHVAIAALIGSGSSFSGQAREGTTVLSHSTAGALTGRGAAAGGASAVKRRHVATGGIMGIGAALHGAAARKATHAASGAVAGKSAMVGSSLHTLKPVSGEPTATETLTGTIGWGAVTRKNSTDAVYDASAATFYMATNTDTTPTGQHNPTPITINTSTRPYWRGGKIIGYTDPDKVWDTGYADGAAIRFLDSVAPKAKNIRMDRVWDATRATRSQNFWFERIWGTYTRDDCCENDWQNAGTFKDVLFDGFNNGISTARRASTLGTADEPDGRNNVIDMIDCLMHHRAAPKAGVTGPTHGGLLKADTVGGLGAGNINPQFHMAGVVCAIERVDHEGYSRLRAGWDRTTVVGPGTYGNWYLNMTDNPLPSNYPMPPAGFTVLNGAAARSKWADIKAAWIAAHPDLNTI